MLLKTFPPLEEKLKVKQPFGEMNEEKKQKLTMNLMKNLTLYYVDGDDEEADEVEITSSQEL